MNDAQEQPQLEQWAWVPPDKVATQRFPGERELRLKVCLLGEPSVGKTSLIRRFVHDLFDDAYVETLGAKLTGKELRVRHRPTAAAFHVGLQLWDIAGQHKADFVRSTHYRGAAGGLVVCDLTRHSTFEAVPRWVDSFHASAGPTPVVLLINKQDLEQGAQVRPAEVRALCSEHGLLAVGTSALSGAGVEQGVRSLLVGLLQGHLRGAPSQE